MRDRCSRIPSRSRKSSRRSSILKAPKPRQPLQSVNLNSSSNESSPATTKLKRRVSFAEKKHVKEFCNSLEQGTVWDNTYEEHDLSNNKVPGVPNQVEHNNDNASKENLCVNKFQDELNVNSEDTAKYETECNDIDHENVDAMDCDLNFTCPVESSRPTCTSQDKDVEVFEDASPVAAETITNYRSKSIVVYRETDENVLEGANFHKSKSIVVYEETNENVEARNHISQLSTVNKSTSKLNKTSMEDAPMEFTEAISNIACLKSYVNEGLTNTRCIEDDNLIEPETELQDMSMEFTQAIPSINILKSNMGQSQYGAFDDGNKDNKNDRTQYFHDTSVEFTMGVQRCMEQSKCNKVLSNVREDIQDMSMEFTMPISSIIRSANRTINGNKKEQNMEHDRTKVFHDMSMEITAAVPLVPHARINLHGHSDLNAAAGKTSDRTVFFHDTSMEMTKAIKGNEECSRNIRADEEDQLLDVSMEMTKVVSVRIHPTEEDKDEDINPYTPMASHDKTKVYTDDAMDFTTAIPALHRTKIHDHRNDMLNNADDNRTKTFNNNSMVFTAVIPPSNIRDNLEEARDVTYNLASKKCDPSNATVFFPNTSMEVTSAISSVLRHPHNVQTNQTLVPHNVSMEITAAVPSSIRSHPMLDKENYISEQSLKYLRKSVFIDEPLQNEAPSHSSDRTSMALHESVARHTNASALNEHNSETACFTAADISGIEEMPVSQSDIRVSPVQKPTTSFSVTRNDPLNDTENKLSTVANNNTSHFKADNRESRAHSTLRLMENLEDTGVNDQDCLMDGSITFFNESLEGIDSIKPPSFVCLDNSSLIEPAAGDVSNREMNETIPVKSAACHEVNETVPVKSTVCENMQNCDYQDYDEMRDNLTRVIDDDITCRTQTFVMRNKTLDTSADDITCNYTNRLEVQDMPKLQMTCMNDTNVENQLLEYSSSTINEMTDVINLSATENCQTREIEIINIDQDESNSKTQTYDVESVMDNSGTDIEKMESNEPSPQYESKENVDLENSMEKDTTTDQNTFSALIKTLKAHAESDDIIWDVYHENIERKSIVVGFISDSLLAVIFFTDDCDENTTDIIKEIKILSRLTDDAGTLIYIVHKIILEKIDTKELMSLYKNYEHVLPMLDHITTEVKLAMDFMFDLKRLSDLNLMDISRERLSFVSRTKRMDIILKVTINIKPLDKIDPRDITIDCLLGSIREEDIKKLIKNIKRDHRFLRRYMSDVTDYIYLMEESSVMTKKIY